MARGLGRAQRIFCRAGDDLQGSGKLSQRDVGPQRSGAWPGRENGTGGARIRPHKAPVTLRYHLHPPSIPTMLSVHSEQLNKTGFPTVHAVVLLEGTMNLTGETQPLVEQLMMVKRMQVHAWHPLLPLGAAWGTWSRALRGEDGADPGPRTWGKLRGGHV